MIDTLMINGYGYKITDNAKDISISLAQEIDKLIPEDSYYRNVNKKYSYDEDLAIQIISCVTGADIDILKKCENIQKIHHKFTHKLVVSVFFPESTEINLKRFYVKEDIYEDEMILPFAEACDLLSTGKSIEIAEYLAAIYLRKNKKEIYTAELAKERVNQFKQLPYNVFVHVLGKHNEAALKVSQYHSKIFNGAGDSKSMASLISMAAEKGVFNNNKLTPLQSTQNTKVGKFFDYIESITQDHGNNNSK